jgi:hypothetical protein
MKFNKPIADAIGTKGRVIQMHENVEDEVGYTAPSSEKPLRAFHETAKWGGDWASVPATWKDKMKAIFGDYIES